MNAGYLVYSAAIEADVLWTFFALILSVSPAIHFPPKFRFVVNSHVLMIRT
jgi:hypothetical protein